jgi:hypothetical protein
MSMTRKWINSQDVEVDATTGALLVEVSASGLTTAASGGTAMNVTNQSKQIAGANPSRRKLIVTNLSTVAMLTLNCGGNAVSGAGAPLAPASDATHPGGTAVIDGDDWLGAVSGIMSAADATANNVAFVEI